MSTKLELQVIPIKLGEGHTPDAAKGCIPFEIACCCVQDTEKNPCFCKNRPPIIIWTPKKGILKSSKSDKINYDGRELTVIELESSSTIFFEKLHPINLGEISKKIEKFGNGSGGTTPHIVNNGQAFIFELLEALHLGVWIGTTLDDAFGLSDWIAGVKTKH